MIGIYIRVYMPNSFIPSTRAAWTISKGKDIELCRKKKIRKAVAIEGKINPAVVFSRLALLNILNRGTITDAKGTIMDNSRIDISRSLFLSRYIWKPYPAIEQITKLARVPIRVFRREFRKARPRDTVERRTLKFSSRWVPKNSFPLIISTLRLVAAVNIQKKGNPEKKQTKIKKIYINKVGSL
jgi:hypothetical protein